ncbi:unnamed protein product [Bursaphelenchus okinawaensis]|uniref:Uncharacterized protein n=1 Tax=Bursaphelenchus okinawaensis TaxID=465554 RepID=A0A811K558_9BILA|nr:unnamed protein product [Bursaphelenchus okinawaensis]CAG9091573.1 unnamed protein product [Bursaphelenchus okinawaensis]
MFKVRSVLQARSCFGFRLNSNGVKNAQNTEVENNMPRHRTKLDYDQSRKFDRSTADAKSGGSERPSAFQRRMMVVTGLYRNTAEIPELVSTQTMNRLHDRNRVVFIVTAVAIVFVIGVNAEKWISRKIEREKASGKSISGMIH